LNVSVSSTANITEVQRLDIVGVQTGPNGSNVTELPGSASLGSDVSGGTLPLISGGSNVADTNQELARLSGAFREGLPISFQAQVTENFDPSQTASATIQYTLSPAP
jgi:hypothetical protein